MLMNRNQYEQAAKDIADAFVIDPTGQSINGLSVKTAQSHNLNPDQIRTVVRLANVEVFQRLFEKKADGDKMIEFTTGDPEAVINDLYKDAQGNVNAGLAKTAGYDMARDFYGDFPKEDFTKEAETTPKEEVEVLRINPQELKFNLNEASDKLRIDKFAAELKWKESIEKASSSFKQAHGLAAGAEFSEFEKNALSIEGEDFLPEMLVLQGMVGGNAANSLACGEKIASLIDQVGIIRDEDKVTMQFLKTAQTSRHEYLQCDRGQELISSYLNQVDAIFSR
jgi:hypothetical protein